MNSQNSNAGQGGMGQAGQGGTVGDVMEVQGVMEGDGGDEECQERVERVHIATLPCGVVDIVVDLLEKSYTVQVEKVEGGQGWDLWCEGIEVDSEEHTALTWQVRGMVAMLVHLEANGMIG